MTRTNANVGQASSLPMEEHPADVVSKFSEKDGVWQIGVPTSGPGAAHSRIHCAGTILNGKYPDNVDAVLVSPKFVVPAAGQQPRLRFSNSVATAKAVERLLVLLAL